MSVATMATTGADMVLSTLPADKAGFSRSFAQSVRRNTKRAGEQLAEVGPIFIRSNTARSSESSTGSGVHA